MNHELLAKAKSLGFSDRQIAHLTDTADEADGSADEANSLYSSERSVWVC